MLIYQTYLTLSKIALGKWIGKIFRNDHFLAFFSPVLLALKSGLMWYQFTYFI
jgi:hypothetical protein